MLRNDYPTDDRIRPSSALSWQRRRGYANARRLAQDVSMLAVANGATCLGWDEEVASLFERAGLGADAIASIGFKVSGSPSTVAVPTFRTWGRCSSRRIADRVAKAASRRGRVVVVVSPSAVTVQPRLANAGRLCRSMCVPAAGDARTIEEWIRASGSEASLGSCTTVLGPPCALERIFGLMVGGWLEIDLDTALHADTVVRLRPEGWKFDWTFIESPTADGRRTPSSTAAAGRVSSLPTEITSDCRWALCDGRWIR